MIKYFLFFAAALNLNAADWVLPAANQGAWIPGTDVGVTGGIGQYLAGGVNDRAVTGTVIDVTASPYFASKTTTQTTGSMTIGSPTLDVANATDFIVGNYVTVGLPEISTMTVTAGASATGNLRFKWGTGNVDIIDVPVTAGWSATQVADAIRASTIFGWALTGTGTSVIATQLEAVAGKSISTTSNGTGVATTVVETRAAVFAITNARIDAITGTTFTLASNAAASVTDAVVLHNNKSQINAAIAAASAGGPTVLYFPAGRYRLDTGFLYSLYKDNITIRGAGMELTTFYHSTANPGFTTTSPGSLHDYFSQAISGTKTKGTSTLSVPDASAYTVGRLCAVLYENEADNARIQAGAAPVWSSAGFKNSRKMTAIVTATSAGSVTIAPPLPADGTNLALLLTTFPSANSTKGWGFEDFSVEYDPAESVTGFINFDAAAEGWVNNVHFKNWAKTDSNGSSIKLTSLYKFEIRKCKFGILPGASTDGAIYTGTTSGLLIEDNIFYGTWDNAIYDNGNTTNSVISYNFSESGGFSIFHNAHPSLNVWEGNVATSHQSDGYHGSSSHNTLFRNRLKSTNGVILNRFKRNYILAGNVLGLDGTNKGSISYGNPNMGNGNANGFAGPTGLSDQVGQIDYSQPGYGYLGGSYNTYVIQPGDIAVGDFWGDWEVTGTLTTRTSDTAGIFAVSGGAWSTGGGITPTVHWNAKASRMTQGSVTSVSGLNIGMSWASGVLPTEGTPVQVYFGSSGWQERDLDVQASTLEVENYKSAASGTGAIADGTADVLPSSLVYSSQPSWWTDGGFSGTWPPVNPDAPSFSSSIIPAGFRFTSTPPPDTAPTLSNATIGTAGTTITFTFTEAVTPGAGGSAGWTLTLSSGSATATYASGSGTTSLVYTLSSTVNAGVTGTVAYTQPGDGLQDGTGNDLVSLSGVSIDNDSSTGPLATQSGWSRRKAIKLLTY